MLVRHQGLLKTLAFLAFGAVPPLEDSQSLLEHAIDRGAGTHRHDIGVHHHVSQPAIAFLWDVRHGKSRENRLFFPRFEPVISRHEGIVFVHFAVPLAPVVELAGTNTNPLSPIGRRVVRFARSIVGRNRRLRRAYHEEPSVRLEFPTLFFCLDVLFH